MVLPTSHYVGKTRGGGGSYSAGPIRIIIIINRKNYILSKKMKIDFLKKKLNLSHLYSTVKTLVTVKPFRTQPAGLNTETPAFRDLQLTIEMPVASYCTVITKVH